MTVATNDTEDVLGPLREVVDTVSAGKVFGAPIEHDGVVVLPVATVKGGGGGGGGAGPAPDGQERSGTGSGFGMAAKPLGVYVLKGGVVTWHPAIDVNRAILGGQLIAVTALLVVRALIRNRAKRPGRH
jgi:uncharacterized spore protein YtfJ